MSILTAMQEDLIRALRDRRGDIRARWETLLRIERVNTPLANPDALVFMIDWTCDELFAALNHPGRRRAGRSPESPARPECPCGRNPLLTYFAAGEQALEEALILEQASRPTLEPAQRDAAFAELQLAVREIARREIESFCAVCQYRMEPRTCSMETAVAAAAAPQVLPAPCNRSR
ncbi:MAG: hypothetical protein Q7S40_27570 [Opitutaceae bacterium]|nr:hypothetical protein [Opitutaceae bacterium]